MTTSPTSASSRSRSAWLASTSAVAQMMGAPGFTAASPVSIPTRSAPKISTSAKNFSLTSALIGAVYQLRRPSARAWACAATATRDFPDPVGVASTTWAPPARARTASSCAAYSENPRSPAQSRKTSKAASGPAAVVPARRSVSRRPRASDQLGEHVTVDVREPLEVEAPLARRVWPQPLEQVGVGAVVGEAVERQGGLAGREPDGEPLALGSVGGPVRLATEADHRRAPHPRRHLRDSAHELEHLQGVRTSLLVGHGREVCRHVSHGRGGLPIARSRHRPRLRACAVPPTVGATAPPVTPPGDPRLPS